MEPRRWALVAATVLLSACGGGGSSPPAAEATASETAAPQAQETVEESRPRDAKKRPRTYTVERGDTLTAIARRFDVTVRALVRANDLDDPDAIVAGQKLRIPRR